ncbi:MAG: anthranilate synthase component I [Gemmataceae bacterium]|nr:anthranilate synthase component I [Gemmataceae bacterium]MDW8264888.1 anthranilate synthase component I [Gemmataceae bacterium]
MRYRPTLDEYVELARAASLVPVYRQLIGDTLTPVSAFCKVQEGDWSFLFESVVGGERVGRYSFLGAGPFLRFEAYERRVQLASVGPPGGPPTVLEHPDPLRRLEEEISRYRAPHVPGLPRFCGGAVGYAAYDAVRYVEHLPHAPPDDRGLPDLSFAFYDRMVIFDHINKTIAAVAHAHVDPSDLLGSYQRACARVDRLVERLQQGVADLQLTDIAPVGEVRRSYTSNFTPAGFEAAVRRCQEYIRAGDAFQIVLSQRLQTETRARPFDIYRALRVLNPSPFMFYLKSGPLVLVGASPEIMVRVEEDKVTIRPLAGTRRRGRTDEEDEQLAAELLADPKERAEHIMLVDLGRNDIGRVARYGTVQLEDVMHVERYSHVMHLSSTVTGRLAPGKTAFDALRACLPAGTLSGAPKVRAMQIIDELEPHRRGPYGGAVGYIDFSGNMDTCIALRTLVLLGQTAYLQAGAGIVYDSVPAKEYEETLNKAMGLLRALEIAETQL